MDRQKQIDDWLTKSPDNKESTQFDKDCVQLNEINEDLLLCFTLNELEMLSWKVKDATSVEDIRGYNMIVQHMKLRIDLLGYIKDEDDLIYTMTYVPFGKWKGFKFNELPLVNLAWKIENQKLTATHWNAVVKALKDGILLKEEFVANKPTINE